MCRGQLWSCWAFPYFTGISAVLEVLQPKFFETQDDLVKVTGGRQKGDGKNNVRKCHNKPVRAFPSNPILSEALPLISSEVRKKGNWLDGHERDLRDTLS